MEWTAEGRVIDVESLFVATISVVRASLLIKFTCSIRNLYCPVSGGKKKVYDIADIGQIIFRLQPSL